MLLNQFQKIKSNQSIWLFILIIIILILGIFFRFDNLSQKVYNADEVRGLYRLSGYTRQEFLEKVFTGDVISNKELQEYQKPTSQRNLNNTLNALAQNPEHTPLYYLIGRYWMQWFGNPIAAKILSIFISLLVIPSLYWLSLELFKLPLAGWIVITLYSISPYQILLAQGAREYSLWTIVTVLSSASLLRALRLKTTSTWIVYAITLAIGLYSHLFFIFVAIGHGIYVLLVEGWRFTKSFILYLCSSLVGLLFFIPWILVIVHNSDKIEAKTNWVRSANLGLNKILNSVFLDNLGDVFFDLNNTTRIEKYVSFLILILAIYSCYFLIRYTPKKAWLFIVILVSLTALAQILPDLIWQGQRSLQSRYLVPTYLGFQLSVSYLLATSLLQPTHVWKKYLGKTILIILLTLGVISGLSISQARDWDYLDQKGTASSLNLQLAPVINQSEQPLIVSEATHSFVLALSHLVSDRVNFQLFNDREVEQWQKKLNLSQAYNHFSDVFILYPDKEFLEFIDRDKKFKRESVANGLYKVIKN
jgi:uncharacterized membrane protein